MSVSLLGFTLHPSGSGTSQMLSDKFTFQMFWWFLCKQMRWSQDCMGKSCWFGCDLSEGLLGAGEYLLLLTSTVPHVSGQSWLHLLCCGHSGCFQWLVNGSWWVCAED